MGTWPRSGDRAGGWPHLRSCHQVEAALGGGGCHQRGTPAQLWRGRLPGTEKGAARQHCHPWARVATEGSAPAHGSHTSRCAQEVGRGGGSQGHHRPEAQEPRSPGAQSREGGHWAADRTGCRAPPACSWLHRKGCRTGGTRDGAGAGPSAQLSVQCQREAGRWGCRGGCSLNSLSPRVWEAPPNIAGGGPSACGCSANRPRKWVGGPVGG